MNRIIHGPNVAGQSLADRVMAAKHTITGQDLVKAVYKATTDEVMGPKRKHLDRKGTSFILNCFQGCSQGQGCKTILGSSLGPEDFICSSAETGEALKPLCWLLSNCYIYIYIYIYIYY